MAAAAQPSPPNASFARQSECDVLVVGSGAGGLTAALVATLEGLDVEVIEKTSLIGGTTSFSGGVVWAPGQAALNGSGENSDIEAARTYLDHIIGRDVDRDRRDAYFSSIQEMLEYLARRTKVRFAPMSDYPDYHPEIEGSAVGRAMAPQPYDARALPLTLFEQIRPPKPETMLFGKMMLDRADLSVVLRPWTSPQAAWRAGRLLLRYWRDRLRRSRGAQLRSGNALVGRLVESLADVGVTPRVSNSLVSLLTDDGRIVGAVVRDANGAREIRSRLGVILATGGFAASDDLRTSLAGPDRVPISVAAEGSVGEGLVISQKVGARLDAEMCQPFYMFPGSVAQATAGHVCTWPHLTFADRGKPGLIAIDGTARRFVNEASSYQVFATRMVQLQRENGQQSFHLVCDAAFIRKYGFGLVRPYAIGQARYRRNGYLIAANDVQSLAGWLGVPSAELRDTIRGHNAMAKAGKDSAFGKGEDIYSRYNGDALQRPNPCLLPINEGTLRAIRIVPAAFASAAGISTDENAQVIDGNGAPLPGLYAVGNDMASIMRGHYPGPGITIGPAMTFAYRAALHLKLQAGDREC